MTVANPFVLDKPDYQRDINFLQHYVQDVAKFLSTMTGDPIEKCTAFVKDNLKPGGVFEFKDPKIKYLERENYEDRVEKEGTLLGYLTDSIRNQELIAPTLTTYTNPKEKQSILVEFVDENVAIRGKAKKAMFAAKMAGNIDLELFKNSEQSNAKIANNAISGGHVSTSTPLHNKTSHSTLTSNCRSTSGYGNANNEKMLSGNRHYHHPTIVINNIISIANRTDLKKLEAVMAEYSMHYPTPEQAMECVLFSTRFYWKSKKQEAIIRELLEKLTPIERAAFVYIGDLFHIAMYNDSVVRNFIEGLSSPSYGDFEDPLKVIKSLREEYVPLATQLLPEHMAGVDWKKLNPKLDEKAEDPEKELERKEADRIKLSHLGATCQNIDKVILEHRSFIECFFVTANVPASLAFFPTSIRRAALTSDTDSTIFTVQDWVEWKTGKMLVDDETNRVAATMIFLAAEAITHILARMSANFGIETERIHQVAMKNEFKFDVFVPTQVGKHYYAYIGCQEGNLFIEYDMEIKGVHLKSSNVPGLVMKKAEQMMKDIMDAAARGEQISIAEKLEQVAQIERDIIAAAIAGDSTYFRSQQIKSKGSYTKEEDQSPYVHYKLWERIFADKYGHMDEPPYAVFKVPVYLPNQRAIRSWLEKIEDKHIRTELEGFFAESGKKAISTFLLPQQRLAVHGVPSEIVLAMDLRRTVLDCTAVFYLILETLGYYCLDDKITELASDYH
ncbi:putative T4-like DNA polymerase [Ralstonia phage RP31]|uniref:Putative T4-like DNA polymerase n=1 Tax=Ralstonia phage RP31 TaxID=1923890 RepID=A0A1L7N1B8_9CAUD|nr:putative T4-like DNA polymerase [Ralstonia phage RP31]